MIDKKEEDIMKKCKITVLKRMFNEELKEQYIKFDDFGLCPFMKEGDVFITGGHFGNECLEGFCPMAWQAICIQASTLAGGGKVYGVDDVHIACCNDGIKIKIIGKIESLHHQDYDGKRVYIELTDKK